MVFCAPPAAMGNEVVLKYPPSPRPAPPRMHWTGLIQSYVLRQVVVERLMAFLCSTSCGGDEAMWLHAVLVT